ncbi:helix-turn-helix transcriptional regulator [Micromonospora chokoriensis]|uniref:helix-turn-helix transcriptional regulator n=1 Tax=Micromonospora chokoriensis TaxID=356851 RepID=UPI0018DCA3EB|nr:helix-turn-helix transcriptional regulator [Micromonospora chokoriensis]
MLWILGITASEQALYEWLLEHPAVALDALDRLAADQPWLGTARPLLSRLEELGLAWRLPGPPARFQAVAPDKVTEVLALGAERTLSRAQAHRARLSTIFRLAGGRHHADELVEILHGKKAINQAFNDVQLSAVHEVRIFDAPPYVSAPPVVDAVELALLRQGIRYRVLYDRRGLDDPDRLANFTEDLSVGEEIRVSTVPIKLVLSDHPLALIPVQLENVDSAMLIRDPALLDVLGALFEISWDQAVPLQVRDGHPQLVEVGDAPSPAEGDLLPLLAAGLTDAAIAAQQGCTERTVRRRVSAMMRRLGAASRFQAGYQAIRRGWITTSADVA